MNHNCKLKITKVISSQLLQKRNLQSHQGASVLKPITMLLCNECQSNMTLDNKMLTAEISERPTVDNAIRSHFKQHHTTTFCASLKHTCAQPTENHHGTHPQLNTLPGMSCHMTYMIKSSFKRNCRCTQTNMHCYYSQPKQQEKQS